MTKIQHMVLFQFKPEVNQEQIDEVFRQLVELTDLIPEILHYAGGCYSSHEGMNGVFTHGFLMTFDNAESRDVYLPHPDHERVKRFIGPLVENVVAFDIEDDS